MNTSKFNIRTAVLVALSFVATGAGVLARQIFSTTNQRVESRNPQGKTEQAAPEAADKEIKPVAENKPLVKTDRYGDPLPEGAMARLGTTRFRHGLMTTKIAFSPDGKVIASGDSMFGIHLWDATSGRLLRRFDKPQYTSSLVYTADGKALFASGGPNMLDTRTGKELRRFQNVLYCRLLALSSDGHKLATNAADQVLIFEVATGKVLFHHQGGSGQVGALAFSPDGKILVSGTRNGTLLFWDTVSGKELRQRQEHEGMVWAVVFSPDGKLLASAGEDGIICIRNMPKVTECARWQGSKEAIRSLAFSPNGALLASSGADGMVHLWVPDTGKEVCRWRACASCVNSITFSPDGKRLATGGALDHAVRLWDSTTGKEVYPVHGHTGMVEIVQFSTDGKTLMSWSQDKSVLAWDPASGEERRRLFGGTPNGKTVGRVALSADGRFLAMTDYPLEGKEDYTIYLWDTDTGQELHALRKHGNPVDALAFSRDGKRLASGDRNNLICIWDVTTGKESHVMPEGQRGVIALAFSPSGKLFASGDVAGTTRLWDSATAKELHRWERSSRSLIFSPDGSQLASISNDDGRSVRVWDVATGEKLRQLGRARFGHDMAFSTSGKLLATTESRDSRLSPGQGVHLWEVFSGQEVRRLVVRDVEVLCLALSPDDRHLATGNSESDILLWDLTGRTTDGRLEPSRPTQAELEQFWTALGSEAPKAYEAKWKLVAAPEQAVQLLKEGLRPVAHNDPQRIARWVADLDSERFDVRQLAMRELKQLGELGEPQLRKARRGQSPLEVRQRVDQLLKMIDGPITDPHRLSALRAVDVLEQIATPEARALLRSLAAGASEARLTKEAKASLARMAGQSD